MHVILFAPAGDPSSQSSDTLMSRQRIYAPPRVLVFGVRCGSAVVAVGARWFRVRPVPSELVRGEGCRGLACRLVAGSLGWCAVFSGSALRVSARTLSDAERGGAERPGDGCPCVGAEETCGVAAMLHGGLVLIAYQSVTPVRASPNTAVN